MSSPRQVSANNNNNKRSLDTTTTPSPVAAAAVSHYHSTATATSGSANKRSRTMILDLFAQQQLQTIQADLEHERNLRLMEQRRFEQTEKRLQKQIELAVQQEQLAQENLTQWQTESDRRMSDLQYARDKALEELRRLQLSSNNSSNLEQEDDDASAIWKQKCHYLEQQIATYENAAMESDEQLKMLQDQMNEWKERKVTASPLPSLQKPVAADLMEAPPDILKELNRLRIQLAEMERKERQLTRKVVDLEQRNKTLLQEREEARKASRRLDQVENSFKKLQSAHDTLLEQMKSWQHFEQEIVAMLKRQGISLCHQDGPPEISTIVRFMDQAQVKLDTVLKDLKRRETECTHYKESNEELKAEMHGLQASVNIHSQEKKDLLGSMERLEQKIAELDGKEAIHLREAESLRALIKTFDELPLKANLGDKALSTSELSTSSKIMEVRLDALQKEIDLLTSVRDELNNKLAQETQLKRDQATELTTVKERFEKLKEALYAERDKKEQAEARAMQAEALAGKGSFNPETTRVLHLTESPLTLVLREEIKTLKQQLEKSGEKAKSKVSLDPEKLNQRLKENFKEQIALFREGIYVMTGLKVDMLPVTDDRPLFRVRSMFAEREDDHLLLKWPAGKEQVKALDILSTDFAKQLSKTHSFEYMKKFQSLPAFLASVQLSLFETQTVAL